MIRGEPDAELRHRRHVVGVVSLVGAALLGTSLSTKPGSPRFYGLTAAVAATWAVGGRVSGRVHRGRTTGGSARRPVLVPLLLGLGSFGVFYGCALVARHIPILNHAIAKILRYAHQGSDSLVLAATLANGAAEEIFFRGAMYPAFDGRRPVVLSTAGYSLATVATGNPALVLASVVMGTLFGLQRRATGGIQAPMITHLVWSTLMLRFLPPLFDEGELSAEGDDQLRDGP